MTSPQVDDQVSSTISDVGGPDLTRLEADVQVMLRGRVRDFSISFDGAGLVIRGEADYFYDKQVALHLVKKESDLPISANLIVVIGR